VREPDEEAVRRLQPNDGETFVGNDRRASKLAIVSAPVETFASVDDLLNSLPNDDDIAMDPGMSAARDSQRVPRERHNVTISARLYASSKESDNDFHCIVGTEGPAQGRSYINAEISGLPNANEQFFQPLQAVREQFKTDLGSNLPGHGYRVWPAGIPIRVSGSLLFDVTHYRQGNQAGTGIYRAQTFWEIHPITALEFEP
jgi:hypothetical protein